MRKHLNQHLFSPLSWVLVILIVLLLTMVLMFLTPLGPKTLAQIASLTVKPLTLKGVSGSFLKGVHVDRFSWDDGNSIVLDHIDIKLEKYDFENGKIFADHVQAERLSINLEPSHNQSDEDVVIPDFGLPLNIDARVVTLKSLRIANKMQPQATETASPGKKNKNADKHTDNRLKILFEIGDLQLEKLRIKDHKLHFSRLQGNPIILDAPLKINVTDGNLNMDQPHDLHTSGIMSFKHVDLGEAKGSIHLNGTLTHYEFVSGLDIHQAQLGEQKLNLQGKGDYKQVSFSLFDLKGASGALKGNGKVAWEPEIKWIFKGEGKGLNTKRWLPDWPAIADAKLIYNGRYAADAKDTKQNKKQNKKQLKNDLDIISLKGKLRGFKLSAKGHVATTGKQISTRGLDVQVGDNQIEAKGFVTEPFDLKLKVDARNLKQILSELAGQIKGRVSVKGSVKKPEIKVKLTARKLVYQEYKQGNEVLYLDGVLSLHNKLLVLKDVVARSGKNSVQASGIVSEPMDIKWKINAQQLSQISPDLGGTIKGDGQVQGNYKTPLIKAILNASSLRFKETRLGRSPIQAKGEVQLQDGVPLIKNLVASSGVNRLQISGRASSPFNLNWNIDTKKLDQLMPDLSGHLKASGQLRGTIDQPLINATLDAKNIRYKTFRLATADFVAQTRNGQYQIKGQLKKLEAGAQKIKTAKLDASGRIQNHQLVFSFRHNDADVMLKAKGGWQNQHWQGALQKLEIRDKAVGNWALQKPVQISASKDRISSSRFCLRHKKTRACSTASWSETGGLSVEGSVKETPLALLKPWLPEGMSFAGKAGGNFSLQQHNGHPKGSIKLTLADSTFTFKTEEGEEQTFAYKNASLNATINDRTIKTSARLNIVNRGKFLAKATIRLSPKDGKHTIDGSAEFDVPNINWAQDFIPHSRGLRGAFSARMTISGLLSSPRMVGNATLKNGYLRLPEAGTELTSINLNVRADKPGQAIISGKMLMGKGVLNVKGHVDTRNMTKWKAEVNIRGKNIRFLNTNEVKAIMTPDLTIEMTPKIIAFKGKVFIPEANINLKDIPELSIDESEDAIVLGEKQKGQNVSAVKVQPDVLIELGDRIKLNAFDLKAKLSGRVRLMHNRRDILAQGALKITEGKYQAYGQNLEINNGRLIFNGSPKLIGMDIRATRKVDDVIVGVQLGGTVLRPKSKIFSDPTMPESDALSILLTGHKLDSVSGQESALLMSAVRGLGVSGSESLLASVGSSIGLDDVNIVTKEDFRQSELALGKRLGSRLYVRYLVGLFDQAQKIAIDYKINKMLSLQAQTGIDNFGLDFIYKIERD